MPVHPTVMKLAQIVHKRGYASLSNKTIEQMRSYFTKLFPEVEVRNVETIQLASGAYIRLYKPDVMQQDMVIVFIKASGFMFGKPTDSDFFCDRLSKRLGCQVACIHHRLAPEFQFPKPWEDCIAAVRELYHYHQKYEINPDKIVLWGESSGGNLAASISHYFRDQNEKCIAMQVLFYPPLDWSQEYPSNIEYGKDFIMDKTISDFFGYNYADHQHFSDPRVSPLLNLNFKDLPHTVLITAQYDIYLDEQVAYFKKLLEAKNSVEMITIPGLVHGFLWHYQLFPEARYVQKLASQKILEFIKK